MTVSRGGQCPINFMRQVGGHCAHRAIWIWRRSENPTPLQKTER